MSQTNKETARKFFVALGSGNSESMRQVLDPSVQAIATGTSILSGTRNFDQIIVAVSMLSNFTKNGILFKTVSMTAEENRVSAEMEGFSILVNDKPYNNIYHFLFTFQDGRITAVKEYFCTKTADEALGPLLAAGTT